MAKKGGCKKSPQTPIPSHKSISLRQETTGKIHTKTNGRNPKSFFKLEHLQNLAVWATRQASIPSLSAFFGRQFAAAGEALGVPPDPTLIPCQRCETLLQPGFNCTVRIEKTRAKSRRRHKKSYISMQNVVVYNCHFCSHRNLKRGTTKGYMKKICPSKGMQKPFSQLKPSNSNIEKSVSLENAAGIKDEMVKTDEILVPLIIGDTSITNTPATRSVVRSGTALLDVKRRKRNRLGAQKSEESDDNNEAKDVERSLNASSKRKRRSWTSLKEIAKSNEHDSTRNGTNLTIPFFI